MENNLTKNENYKRQDNLQSTHRGILNCKQTKRYLYRVNKMICNKSGTFLFKYSTTLLPSLPFVAKER